MGKKHEDISLNRRHRWQVNRGKIFDITTIREITLKP